jgi:uncharacterized membrane protein
MNRGTRTFILGFILITVGLYMLHGKKDTYYDQGYLPFIDWVMGIVDVLIIFSGLSKVNRTTD